MAKPNLTTLVHWVGNDGKLIEIMDHEELTKHMPVNQSIQHGFIYELNSRIYQVTDVQVVFLEDDTVRITVTVQSKN